MDLVVAEHQQQNKTCIYKNRRVQRLLRRAADRRGMEFWPQILWSWGTTTCASERSKACRIRRPRHKMMLLIGLLVKPLIVWILWETHLLSIWVCKDIMFTCQQPITIQLCSVAPEAGEPLALITTNPTGGNSDHPKPVVSKTSLDHRETCRTTLMSIISRPLMREPLPPFPWKLVRSRKEGKHQERVSFSLASNLVVIMAATVLRVVGIASRADSQTISRGVS